MNTVTYGVVSETYSFGGTVRNTYGIAVYANADWDGTGAIIASVHDISTEKEKIAELVSLCNRYHLAPEHLRDVIDDFLIA